MLQVAEDSSKDKGAREESSATPSVSSSNKEIGSVDSSTLGEGFDPNIKVIVERLRKVLFNLGSTLGTLFQAIRN